MAVDVIRVTWLILPLFLFSEMLNGQQTRYQEQELKQTDLTLIASYYGQDGDHSAITGGEGTEKLSVYSIQSVLSKQRDSSRWMDYGLAIDYISSASTDKIDFNVSSASRHDQRIYGFVGMRKQYFQNGSAINSRLSLSIESDYLSVGALLGWSKTSVDKTREMALSFQYFWDDLRWRKNVFVPTELIYPAELRDTTWFDGHTRQSFNLTSMFRWDLNRRMSLAVFPGVIYQTGILSTPFHRVFFSDSREKAVENLPSKRWQIPFGLQLNSFVTPFLVSRLQYQLYWDDHGITGHTGSISIPVKLGTFVSIIPSLRYYTQTASDFFDVYRGHSIASEYHTSDYDLSAFNSLRFGIEFRSNSNRKVLRKKWLFDEFAVRYSYYRRSDELSAHIISTVFDLSR